MKRSVIVYGIALAGLLVLLKWLEWRFIIFDHAIELYSGALAVVFTGLGIWLAMKLARPKVRTVVVEIGRAPKPEGREPDGATKTEWREPDGATKTEWRNGPAGGRSEGAARDEARGVGAEVARDEAREAQGVAEVPVREIDAKEVARLGLSGREQEVLQLMAEGLSNQEIADRLFLSLNTIKTHCSRIFEKLEVKRRTQAIEKSKRLRLIR